MDVIKGDLCLFNELLYALNGIFSHNYPLEMLLNFESIFTTVHCLPQISDLLHLASLYFQVNNYFAKSATETDEFKFMIYDMIYKVVYKTYLNDLTLLDYYNTLNNEGVIKLNELLKYKHLFTDILNITNELNDENKCLALFKLTNLFENKYEIVFTCENDPFFQGMWSWVMRGVLPLNHRDSFFISIQSMDNYSLNFSKFPDSIDPQNAVKIHNIGSLLRYIDSQGVQIQLYHSQLYWKYFNQRHETYKSKALFKHFLTDVKTFVFENVLKITKAKANFLEYLHHLKTFFLFGNECFWNNFIKIYREYSDEESDVRKLFRKAIYFTFDYFTADHYISCINVKVEKRKNLDHVKLSIKHSPMITILLNENSLNRYQTILSHLFKLHSTRYDLTTKWKDQNRSTCYFSKYWYLHYCLLRTFTIFYTYSKFCIEHKITNYTSSIENTVEIDEIQKFHDACLVDIIKRLFIKNSFIVNLQRGLIELCHKMHEPGCDIDPLLVEYRQIMKTFRSSIQLNRKHINLFGEILDLI